MDIAQLHIAQLARTSLHGNEIRVESIPSYD